MDKLPNFVVNGGVKMPVGYRFHPTDEELVIHYLKRKAHATPLPASIIPEFDVFQTHPWGLPGDYREKRYFFYNNEFKGKIMNVNEDIENKLGKRAAGCGYWKPIGKEKQVVASETNEAVGIRKTLVFCGRKRHHGIKTRWLMHEYRLLASQTNPTQASKTEVGNWVVYRVFQKKRKPQRSAAGRSSPLIAPSSSCSSDITELSSNANGLDSDQEEKPQRSAASCSSPLIAPSSSCSSDITELSYNANGLYSDQEENSAANTWVNM